MGIFEEVKKKKKDMIRIRRLREGRILIGKVMEEIFLRDIVVG